MSPSTRVNRAIRATRAVCPLTLTVAITLVGAALLVAGVIGGVRVKAVRAIGLKTHP